jgi:hypothetical protein
MVSMHCFFICMISVRQVQHRFSWLENPHTYDTVYMHFFSHAIIQNVCRACIQQKERFPNLRLKELWQRSLMGALCALGARCTVALIGFAYIFARTSCAFLKSRKCVHVCVHMCVSYVCMLYAWMCACVQAKCHFMPALLHQCVYARK